MRVLRNTALSVLSPTFVGADGETPTDTASTPTAAVSREDGSSLTAMTVTASSVSDGVYSAALTTTHTGQLDRLKVTWGGTAGSLVQSYVTELEVVGAHHVSITELREESGLDNTTTVPLHRIRRVRDSLANRIEDACGVAFVPRYERDVLCGNGRSILSLSHPRPITLIAVTVDGTSVSTSNFSLHDQGLIEYEGTAFPTSSTGPNVVVTYEHGFPACPEDIRHETIKAIRYELRRYSDPHATDVLSQTFENGATIRYPTASPDRPTGLPSFDAVLARYKFRPPAVG